MSLTSVVGTKMLRRLFQLCVTLRRRIKRTFKKMYLSTATITNSDGVLKIVRPNFLELIYWGEKMHKDRSPQHKIRLYKKFKLTEKLKNSHTYLTVNLDVFQRCLPWDQKKIMHNFFMWFVLCGTRLIWMSQLSADKAQLVNPCSEDYSIMCDSMSYECPSDAKKG